MNPSAFLTGCVAHKGRDVPIFSVATLPPNAGTVFFARLESDWIRYSVEVDWAAIAMASIQYSNAVDLLVVAFGVQGQFWELEPGRSAQRIGQLPEEVTDITNAVAALDAIWICGMDRITWKRDSNGKWHDYSAPPGTDDDGVVGFSALAQTGRDSLVAVGWRGEIWWFNESGWDKQDSGSNANFNGVTAKPHGEVVVVGDRGAIVEGSIGRWQAYATSAAFNLQDVCYFDGEVFVCSDFEIFFWRDGVLMPETRFANHERPGSCMRLRTGKQFLLCIGEGGVFKFYQGVWGRII